MAITRENHLLFPNSQRLFSGMGSSCQSVPHSGQCFKSGKEIIEIFRERIVEFIGHNSAREYSRERGCRPVYFFPATNVDTPLMASATVPSVQIARKQSTSLAMSALVILMP